MTDALGYRAKFGVLGPSTNTIVQPDFDDMRPAGVTNHYSRIIIQNAQAISDESFMQGTLEIDRCTVDAVKGVLTCAPDYLVMGMSAVTFYGGAEGAAKWKQNIEEVSGLRISTGSESVVAALQALGNIKKVSFLSPYFPVANTEVANFLSDHGYETVRDKPLRRPSWTAIAETTPTMVREAVAEIDGDEVEAIIQVGTNLSMVKQAAQLELELGKPVIAINTATYWHALRAYGIPDKISGFGRLLEEH
ncbi:arylmalonate decarboxylase [Parahaliea maris]|uniref:Arylmalonate decarboxylase n=1 Tax=Parahaliea maris TaxID=2716870 RepID=A0A5C8ZW18_9GAMM|nr:arylmalonate decarboxylase [Parahaliea maris]TXS91964.1 arylmalonate decarboxylase [Parahaliea maris]